MPRDYDDKKKKERKSKKSMKRGDYHKHTQNGYQGGKKQTTLDVNKECKVLETVRNYKETNNLYEIARTNENFDLGIQWEDVDSKNLKQSVYNIVGQINSVKLSSILANEISTQRTADEIDMDDSEVQAAIRAFNLADKKNWERLKMDRIGRMVGSDGTKQGIGLSFFYWDDDIELGNTHKTKGDINVQTVDMVDFYAVNSSEVDIQKQIGIKLTVELTVKELKQMGEKYDLSEEEIEMIKPDDEDDTYRPFNRDGRIDSNSHEENRIAILIIHLEFIDGTVHVARSTKTVKFHNWEDTELKRYPISMFTYKERKRFIYGEAEMTRYIENQRIVNTQTAARHLHALMMAVPQTFLNESAIDSYTGAIGSIFKVKLPLDVPIGNVFKQTQPTAMGSDVDKSLADGIQLTKDLAGVNQNLEGAARPENAAALLTQIKQASVPIQPYRDRFYNWVEDSLLIWSEFYCTKYNLERKIKDKETGEIISFVGTEFRELKLQVKIDVGASTIWSEITQLQALNDMWDNGIITDPNDYISRLPDNLIKNQEGLLKKSVDKQLLRKFIEIFMQSLPPEVQQQVSQMDEDEQKEKLGQMVGLGGQNGQVPALQSQPQV